MNLKEIQELIKFVSKAGVSEVEIQQKDFKIVIKTTNGEHGAITAAPQVISVAQPVAQVAAAPVAAPQTEVAAEKPVDNGKTITIKSPMIGTFYRSSGPDKPSFVNVGDEIKQGSVICIIEAMKLFNEIEAEVSGRIVKVLIDDSSPVEYEQPLFLVEPF
jgi:acetyl-CoA carboxylase biotin carboxyl carrier protein